MNGSGHFQVETRKEMTTPSAPEPPDSPPANGERVHHAAAGAGKPAVASRVRPAPLNSFGAGALVFFNSAAVLVIEIVATRLMAPYVGVTLQTYTAIIGVVLAGIAFGSWLGGLVADWLNPRKTLGPLLIVGGVLAMSVLPITRVAGGLAEGQGSANILVLALISFFWPAAVLSAINPTVVKLQLERLDQTGRIVGRLSAVATAGAIFGTILTGFVLLAWLPTSTIVISLGAGLIAAGVVVTARLTGWRARFSSTAALSVVVLVGGLSLAAGSPCQRETAYFCANVVHAAPGSTDRVLVLDGIRQSYVDIEDPTHLKFSYTERMADLINAFRPSRMPIRALEIGGGGFTLPRYIAATRPGSSNVVLELDPNVVKIAREQLGLATGPRLHVQVGDARVSLRTERNHAADIVIGDAYAGRAVPWHLTTREFILDIRRKLRAGGVYTMNCIDAGSLSFVRAAAATLRSVFPYVAMEARFGELQAGIGENFVFFASDEPLPLAALIAGARERRDGETLEAGASLVRFVEHAQVLRDDYAPVDQLITRNG